MSGTRWVRRASDPSGRSFALFIGPPGSTRDAGESVTLIRFLISAAGTLFRSMSRRWRIAVNELFADGRLGPIVRRESFATETECTARLEELVSLIERGGHGFPPSWWR